MHRGGPAIPASEIDWDNERVTCPRGKRSSGWTPKRSEAGEPIDPGVFPKRRLQFVLHEESVHSGEGWAAGVVRPRAQHEALRDARARFMVEGTPSQGVGAFGLRKTRYRGLAKTGLQHVATASAMNLIRFQTYLQGVPQERGPDVAVLGSGSVKPGFASRITLPSGFGYSKAWMNKGSIPTPRPVEFILNPWGLGRG